MVHNSTTILKVPMYTKFFSGFGRTSGRYWKNAGLREVFKFSFYLAIPVVSSIIYANNDLMHLLTTTINPVVYPPANPDKIPLTVENYEVLKEKYKKDREQSQRESEGDGK